MSFKAINRAAPDAGNPRVVEEEVDLCKIQSLVESIDGDAVKEVLSSRFRRSDSQCSLLSYLQSCDSDVPGHVVAATLLEELCETTDRAAFESMMVYRYIKEHDLWKDHPDCSIRTAEEFIEQLQSSVNVKTNIVVGSLVAEKKMGYIKEIASVWGADWFGKLPKEIIDPDWKTARDCSKQVLIQMRANCQQDIPMDAAIKGWTEGLHDRLDEGKRRALKLRTPRTAWLIPEDIRALNRQTRADKVRPIGDDGFVVKMLQPAPAVKKMNGEVAAEKTGKNRSTGAKSVSKEEGGTVTSTQTKDRRRQTRRGTQGETPEKHATEKAKPKSPAVEISSHESSSDIEDDDDTDVAGTKGKPAATEDDDNMDVVNQKDRPTGGTSRDDVVPKPAVEAVKTTLPKAINPNSESAETPTSPVSNERPCDGRRLANAWKEISVVIDRVLLGGGATAFQQHQCCPECEGHLVACVAMLAQLREKVNILETVDHHGTMEESRKRKRLDDEGGTVDTSTAGEG